MKNQSTKKLVLAALFLALAYLLPFLTGQIPEIGSMLLPMHLPVLICGFVCGWPYGLAVGFAAPLLRSFTLGMPPPFPPLPKEKAWMRLLTCRADAPKRQSAPAARAVGRLAVSRNKTSCFPPRPVRSCAESRPEPVPYSIANKKMGRGPTAESPSRRNTAAAPRTTASSVPNNPTACGVLDAANALRQQLR